MLNFVEIKFCFFRHYWWLLSLIIVIGTLFLTLHLKEQLPTIVTAIGAILSLIYFLQKQKLEELRLFRELFKEFNGRYEKINKKLSYICKSNLRAISDDEQRILIDYFNLCGEEYFYFQRGYIDPTVWKAWENGMKIILQAPCVKPLWDAEKTTGSYYGLKL